MFQPSFKIFVSLSCLVCMYYIHEREKKCTDSQYFLFVCRVCCVLFSALFFFHTLLECCRMFGVQLAFSYFKV